MVRIPTHRAPTHPGEMLREEFLVPMNISQRDLADAIHVPYQRVNELVNQKRGRIRFIGRSPFVVVISFARTTITKDDRPIFSCFCFGIYEGVFLDRSLRTTGYFSGLGL